MTELTPEVAGLIRNHLQRILNADMFRRKRNAQRLLRFVVKEILDGRKDQLTRDYIRRSCFGPNATAEQVSTEKVRLRRFLREYYAGPGQADDIQIQMSSTGFHLEFESRSHTTPADETYFCGRSREMTILQRRFVQASRGECVMACVIGEPGMGKTTLVTEFATDVVRSNPGVRLLSAHGPECMDSPESYLPIQEALRLLIQGQGELAIRMDEQLRASAPSWHRILEVPTELSQRVRPSLAELDSFLRIISAPGTIILLIENLHLADESTGRILRHLIEQPLCLLIVATYRKDEMSTRSGSQLPIDLNQLTRSSRYEVIGLTPLTLWDVQEYLSKRFSGNIFPPDLSILLHRKTGGNPFFVTEVVQYLVSRGVVTDTVSSDKRWCLAMAPPDIGRELPSSISTMIQVNINRLAERERTALLAAALQGEEFESAVIARVLSMDAADVEATLEGIERKHRLISFVANRRFGQKAHTVRYRFLHTLYQEALLGLFSRIPTRAEQWASETASAMVELAEQDNVSDAAGSDRKPIEGELAPQVAVLYEMAGDLNRALQAYLAAAEDAAGKFAHHTAIDIARRALRLLPRLSEDPVQCSAEMKLRLILANSIVSTRGYADPELKELYDRALKLTNDPLLCLRIQYGLWIFHVSSGSLKSARNTIEEVFYASRRLGDQTLTVEPEQALGTTLIQLGDLNLAHEYLSHALNQYNEQRQRTFAFYDLDPMATIRTQSARVLWLRGFPDTALQTVKAALEAAPAHPESRGYILVFAADINHFCGNVSNAMKYSDGAIAVAREYGLAQELAWATMIRAWAIAEEGDLPEAISIFNQNLSFYRSMGSRVALTKFLALLAQVHLRAGNIEDGHRAINEAFAIGEETGERYYLSELYRIRGELLLSGHAAESRSSEAEQCFLTALSISREMGARSLELRAAISRCKVASKVEHVRSAQWQYLSRLYATFEEGHDTSDLLIAKQLIDNAV